MVYEPGSRDKPPVPERLEHPLERPLPLPESGQIMPLREQGSTLLTDTAGSQGKVALNKLGRAFEEPFKVQMPFDMGNCSEHGLRDLNVSSTLTFGVDCLEQITLKSWRKSFGFFFSPLLSSLWTF